ncbi:serine O-acetyltransferase [Geodermatophilus nigrescens]
MPDPARRPDVTISPVLARLRDQLREDRRVNGGVLKPGFHAVAVHRLAGWARTGAPRPLRPPARALAKAGSVFVRNVYGIEIPYTVEMGRRVKIAHQNGIVLHPLTQLGDDVVLRQGVSLGAAFGDPGRFDGQAPSLGAGVSVGAGAVVVGGVHIGDGAVIGPNATVLTNVPAGARVLAPPPRVISFPASVAAREESLRGR